jgi:aryl-alcohol dehydrogenase-like predicted oxidoreductase
MIQYNPDLYGLEFTYDEFHGMPWKQVGNSGLRAPVIGLGTWKFGYPETGDGARVGEKEAFTILDKAWEEGVLLWDTANRYNASSGNSERVLGKWFAKNPEKRRDVILATKMFGAMDGKHPTTADCPVTISRMRFMLAWIGCKPNTSICCISIDLIPLLR